MPGVAGLGWPLAAGATVFPGKPTHKAVGPRRCEAPRATGSPSCKSAMAAISSDSSSRMVPVPVAQLDRASASGAEGYRFESCRGYSDGRAASEGWAAPVQSPAWRKGALGRRYA